MTAIKASRSAPKKRWRTTSREIAAVRALAILRAMDALIEAVHSRRAWREFELVWFLRRIDEARVSLRGAAPKVRIGFIDDLRTSYRSFRDAADADPSATGEAARLIREALRHLFDEIEDRVAEPLETSADIYAAAERIRRAGGFPFFNMVTRTVDRMPKAKAIDGSVWVVRQDTDGRSYSLAHGPSGVKVLLPSLPRPTIEEIARYMAREASELARDATLMHELPGGPSGTRLVGGIESKALINELHQIRNRAMAKAGVSFAMPPALRVARRS